MEKCKLKYFGTPPSDNSVLITCSIFQLKKMYQELNIYTSGLLKLIKYVTELDYHILIYFDNSIKNNKHFEKLLLDYSNHKYVYFCEYECPEYFNKNKYHRNVFGMYIRLIPLFDISIKYKCVYVSDIDYTDIELLFFIKSHINIFLKSKYKYACNYKIGYEWKYNLLFNIPNVNITVLSNLLLKEHILSPDFLFNFLEKLKNNNKLISNIQNQIVNFKKKQEYLARIKYRKTVNTSIFEKEDIKYTPDLFSYGIDEYFTNKYIIPELNYKDIGVFYIYDNLSRYVKNIINYETVNNSYTKSIIDTNNFVETLNNIFQLKGDKPIQYKLELFNKIKNKYIDETMMYFKKNEKYIGGKDYKDFLCNLLIHKFDGLSQSLYNTENITDYIVEYIKNLKIYSFQDLISIKNNCDKLFKREQCLTFDEIKKYLIKINQYYNYNVNIRNNFRNIDICEGNIEENVKTLNKNEINIIINLGKRVIDLLEENNILYWIDGGTLLGSLQNGKFIPWDDDMDIVIPTEYFNQLLNIINNNKNEIEKKYNFKFIFNPRGRKENLLINKRFNIFHIEVHDLNNKKYFIDLILITLINNNYYLPLNIHKDYNYNIYDVFPLRKIKFENQWVNCPRNPYPFINNGYPFWRHIGVASHSHLNELKNRTNKIFYIFKNPYLYNQELKENYNVLDTLNIIKVYEQNNKKVLSLVKDFMDIIKNKNLDLIVDNIYDFYKKINKMNILKSIISKLYVENSINNYNGIIINNKIITL